MVIFSKPRQALKRKLVIMALETIDGGHHCRNPDNWELVQVVDPFIFDFHPFLSSDITVICISDGQLDALCTRIIKVVGLPIAFRSRFKTLEDL